MTDRFKFNIKAGEEKELLQQALIMLELANQFYADCARDGKPAYVKTHLFRIEHAKMREFLERCRGD